MLANQKEVWESQQILVQSFDIWKIFVFRWNIVWWLELAMRVLELKQLLDILYTVYTSPHAASTQVIVDCE